MTLTSICNSSKSNVIVGLCICATDHAWAFPFCHGALVVLSWRWQSLEHNQMTGPLKENSVDGKRQKHECICPAQTGKARGWQQNIHRLAQYRDDSRPGFFEQSSRFGKKVQSIFLECKNGVFLLGCNLKEHKRTFEVIIIYNIGLCMPNYLAWHLFINMFC